MENDHLNYTPTLDEIVFEHRNKEYGAYDIRTSYRRILTRSLVIGTALFCLAAISPIVVMKIKQLTAKDKTEVKADLMEILPEEDKPKEEIKEKEEAPPPPPPKQEEKIEIIQNVVPEPVKAPKVETPPPPISEQLKTTTGLINQEGVKQAAYAPPAVQAPPRAAVESKAPSTTEVYESVDQDAEFPGGGLGALEISFLKILILVQWKEVKVPSKLQLHLLLKEMVLLQTLKYKEVIQILIKKQLELLRALEQSGNQLRLMISR
jgi:protein TonB